MNKQEEIVLLSTIEKAVKARLADLKDDFKSELMELELDYGVDRMALKIAEEKVGEVIITRAKQTVELNPSCQDAIYNLDNYGLAELVPAKGWQEHFKVLVDGTVIDEDGEIVDWLVPVQSYVKGTMVKVDHKKVLPYIANDYLAEGAVRSLLLGSGE